LDLKRFMISIIIPTLNEKDYLPLLLDSIKKQDFSDYEIIVADAGSGDNTVEIAKKYGCKIVPGGLPAEGKNNGAREARGSLLLFLDADVFLVPGFFKKSVKEFNKRKLGIASFRLLPRESKIGRFLFDFFYNLPVRLMEKFLPHAAMGILVEKKLFDKVGGFDPTIKIAEDHDLARRIAKISKFGIIKSTKLYVSERRFKKDGWLKTFLKYIFTEIHMIFLGPVKKDIFKYEFDGYSKIVKKDIKYFYKKDNNK